MYMLWILLILCLKLQTVVFLNNGDIFIVVTFDFFTDDVVKGIYYYFFFILDSYILCKPIMCHVSSRVCCFAVILHGLFFIYLNSALAFWHFNIFT